MQASRSWRSCRSSPSRSPSTTPTAGIFAVLEKEKEHRSSLYDDAEMPNMQRVTWNGIALHGGPLPGYAASHGCVRMPFGFAEKLPREAAEAARTAAEAKKAAADAARDTAALAASLRKLEGLKTRAAAEL